MFLTRFQGAATVCLVTLVSASVSAEELGSLSTGGANQVTNWCSDGTNTFSTGCTDSLEDLLRGPQATYPPPSPSSPGGNVELGDPPATINWTTSTTLSGSFLGGDTITVESLTEADWTQSFCEQWVADITAGNGVVLTGPQVTTACNELRTDPQLLLKQASNPNISYVSKNGTVLIGTATLFNASPALKTIAVLAGENPDDVPDLVQFSEPVKVTYEGETSILYCDTIGSITQTGQWANDSSCQLDPNLAKQFCSHSGNCEVSIGTPPTPPAPIPAISALGLAGSAAGLLAIGLAGLRRRRQD